MSGLTTISLAGILHALRERRVIPGVITGVSGGPWAAMSALGDCYNDGHASYFIKMVRDEFLSHPIRRFFPPYRHQGIPIKLLRYSIAHSKDPDYLRELGVRHFYVGYTSLPFFQFRVQDVLRLRKRHDVFRILWKSSAIPFVTHHGFHCEWALDGGFRKMAFPSRRRVRERWVLTCHPKVLRMLVGWRHFDRIIPVQTRIRNPFNASDEQIDASFEVAYEQGMRLSV